MTTNDQSFVCTRCLTVAGRSGGAVRMRDHLAGLILAAACSGSLALGGEAALTARADSRPAIIHKATMGNYGSDYVRLGRLGDLDGDGMLDLPCIQAHLSPPHHLIS